MNSKVFNTPMKLGTSSRGTGLSRKPYEINGQYKYSGTVCSYMSDLICVNKEDYGGHNQDNWKTIFYYTPHDTIKKLSNHEGKYAHGEVVIIKSRYTGKIPQFVWCIHGIVSSKAEFKIYNNYKA